MEIIITESQLSKILTEQDNFIIKDTYKHIVNAVAGIGTNPDGVLSALGNIKNQNGFKSLVSLFKDKKTGYSSFDEMINGEYEMDNYDDIVKLVNKLREFGVITRYMRGENRLGQKLFTGNFKTTFGKDPSGITRVGPSCKSKWSPHLKRAKDYWIQWLSNPITKSKFKKNWGVGVDNKIDGITVDDLFKKYINTLNVINLVYYDNVNPPYSDVESAYAFVNQSEPTKVYVNCSLNDDTPYETLIHEIQHTLYNVKPLNPSVKIGDVFVKEGTKKMTPKDFFNKNDASTETKIQFNKNLNKSIEVVSKKYGVDEMVLHEWLHYAKVKEKEDPGYSCETTEKMSNIMAIRKYFNLKPGGNITKEMLKPYIDKDKHQTDIYWVLNCWALNGFPDINIMLSKINNLAYQENNNNTRIA
jgi:hypothetical protein